MTHYFVTPETPGAEHRVTATIWGTDHHFIAADGVFSRTRLDPGTAVLLRQLDPPRDARRVLDLGCGFGPIAVALATAVPQARVDAVDVNDLALDLTRRNAASAGVGDRVRALRPEQADPSVRYDQIWTNPPIRIGKAHLHELLATWLPRLAPDGVAHLVVARNLGADSLARWLADEGWTVDRVASSKGYRVLRVGA